MFARLLRFIFGPHTFEIVAFFLAATGVSFALSADGEDVVKAHWFFGAAFLLSLGRVAHLVLTWREASSVRYVLSFFLFGVIGFGWVLTYDWIQKKADKLAIAKTSESPSSSPTETPKTNANASPPASNPESGRKTPKETLHKALPPDLSTPTPVPKGPRLGIGPEAYKDVSDEQVGQWAMEEADKIEELANRAMNYWGGVGAGVSPNAIGWRFTNEFNDCCAQDVKELRTEVLRRLGPPAKDPEEIQAWTALFPELKYPEFKNGMPERINLGSVEYYAPYLRRLGLRLKRRTVPRSVPKPLQFSEQQLPPEKPGYSRIVVTIEMKKELLSGYIAVQFRGQPYSVGCDFEDSRLALTSKNFIDDPTLTKLLEEPTNYILKIGKTPFGPNKAIHVEAKAGSPIHVSAVTFFEE